MIAKLVALVAASAVLQAAQPPCAPANASERWQQDIAVVRSEFLKKDLSYTPEAKAYATRLLAELAQRAPTLTEQEIVSGLARVAALAGNAHTRAYAVRGRQWWRRYPIRIWKFADGWRVVATQPEYENLLGARIRTIGGKPVQAVEAGLRPLYAGPESWAGYMASYTLTSPDALLGSHVIAGAGQATFGVERDGRRFSVTVEPALQPRSTATEESWWFLTPVHPAVDGWRQVLAGRPLPTYLSSARDWYGLRRCENNILYFTFNRAEDQPGAMPLAEFADKALRKIASDPNASLVVDLRFNTGGNLQKTQPLFEGIARLPQGRAQGRLFVILGSSTFSAGITPAAILNQNAHPIILGTAPGDNSVFWAEGGNIVLPNSGLTMHYADRAHVYATPSRQIPEDLTYLKLSGGSLAPKHPVGLRYQDYLSGRDRVAEVVSPRGLRCGPSIVE